MSYEWLWPILENMDIDKIILHNKMVLLKQMNQEKFPHDKFPDRTNLSNNTVTGNCLPDHVI